MRKLLCGTYRRLGTRSSCSIENLVKAQALLQNNKALSAKTAADFSEYFNIAGVKGKSSEKTVSHFFKETCKQIENDKMSNLVRMQNEEVAKGNDLPIFLAYCDPETKSVTLFSVAKEERVAVVKRDGDMWELTDEMMRHTRGRSRFILIPVISSEEERATMQATMEWLHQALKQQGLLPVTHVDNLMLVASFIKDPPPLKEPKGKKAGIASNGWFRMHWVHLQTVTCNADEPDPVKALNNHICPQFDVFVIHVVRAGSRTLNISLWSPTRRQRYVAKGMLSDILSCLFSTHSKHLILVPTNRTDRPTLFRCRTALLKSGADCAIVFASVINDKYRQAYHPDPSRYWMALKDATDSLDTDLLFDIQKAAGNNIREFQQKRIQTSEVKAQELSTKTSDMTTQTSVGKWLSLFSLPERVKSEKAELKHYARYLVIAYTTTDHSAYGQPHNPTAQCNYILSTCLLDYHGHALEPWSVFKKRGEYHLPSLKGVDVLVVHDAKTFLLYVWGDEELQLFLRRGGRVWCTQLAEYFLDAQRCHTGCNDLNTVALKYGSLVPPGSVIGVDRENLPLAFHRHFLLKAAPAVLLFFQEQLKRAVQQSQLVSVSLRMNSLLAMASMEHTGIHIDVAEAQRQSKALGNLINTMDRALEAYVPAEVPMDMRMHFDWGSPTHLHAYFFGGKISLGYSAAARESRLWTSNLVHLCQQYGSFNKLIGELHLQRFAAQHGLATKGSLPQRISTFMHKSGSAAKKKYRLVLLDIETTGLNVSTDEIIEIALYDPVENTSFSSLIKPKRKITPRTVRIHQITNEAVASAPPIEKVVEGVAKYLRIVNGAENSDEVVVLIGHNVFSLDEPMLRRAFDTYFTDSAHDGILYCDSIALLRALKLELQHSKASDVKTDHALLETLTSSLRLSNLIENLRVVPEGTLHRAVTDTKALWFVLVQAFNLQGLPAPKQRDHLFAKAADSLIPFPTTGSFMPTERKRPTAEVRLPGVAHQVIQKPKFLASLAAKPFSDTILETLHVRGVKEAELVLQRYRIDQHAVRFLQLNKENLCTLHPDSKVHQRIDMTATKTTRTTSGYPSCQNIPKDDKSSVRRLFVSRYGEDGRLVEIDYSQLEIVVLGILCNDKKLSKDLNNGVDFHIKRAAFFSGLPYKEIYEGYRRGVPKYKTLRKVAKQFSFQRLYGAGVPLLHKTTGIPVEDLNRLIASEDKEFPDIDKFHRTVRAVALRPNNPGLPTNFIVEMPTGMRLCFKTKDVILNLPAMKNYPIQGYGAEIAQMMVGRVFRNFCAKQFYDGKAHLINFVHDSVWLDCHVDVLEDCVRETSAILSDVHNFVPKAFPGVHVSVPLKVSSACGLDMCAMDTISGDDFSFVSSQRKSDSQDMRLNFLEIETESPTDLGVNGSEEVEVDEEDVEHEETQSAATTNSKEVSSLSDEVIVHI